MKNKDIRYNLDTLPAWEPTPPGFHEAQEKAGDKASGVPLGKVYWSGAPLVPEPPAIGDRVFVNMNGFGPGTVRGYFVEWGWLGVYVRIDNPPAWYRKQIAADPDQGPRPNNPERVPMIFGAELGANVGKAVQG